MQKNEPLVIFIIKFFIVTLFKNSGNSIELVIILNFGKLFFAVNFGNFKNIIFSRIIYSILWIFKERVEYIKLTLIVFNDIKNFKFYFFTVITDKGNESGVYSLAIPGPPVFKKFGFAFFTVIILQFFERLVKMFNTFD